MIEWLDVQRLIITYIYNVFYWVDESDGFGTEEIGIPYGDKPQETSGFCSNGAVRAEQKISTFVDWGWTILTKQHGKRMILSDGDVASGPSRAALFVLVCELIETKNRRVVLSISSSVPEPSREEGALD
jgi:hypothetical protein